MNDKITNIKIAGLGGMGVLTSTQIVAEVFFRQGLDVKKAEVHGMSQRGGSICSDVRAGKKVFSPMIPSGEIDFLVVFKEDQLPLYQPDCSAQTVIIHPGMIDASKLSNKRTFNIAMLGLLSRHLKVPAEAWLEVIHSILPEKLHEVNDAAFELGRQTV